MKAGSGEAREYRNLAKRYAPPRPVLRNVALAFLVGGAICLVGEGVFALVAPRVAGKQLAVSLTSGVMIAIGALLTGLGLYDEIGRLGGMGSAIPVTGFANSIVSPAMEFKREGFVLGVTAKMFVIAGPVIVYGLVTAFVVAALKIMLQVAGVT